MRRFITRLNLLLLVAPFWINAQQLQYVFQHLTTKDGLASDFAKFIFQDTKGFYYIGNGNGFQTFDGRNFTNIPFRNRYARSQLLDDPVPSPLEDKAGNLYIPNQGVIMMYGRNGKTDTIRITKPGTNTTAHLNDMCKDDEDNIWLCSPTTVYKVGKNNQTLVPWAELSKQKREGTRTRMVPGKAGGTIWLVQEDQVYVIDTKLKNSLKRVFSLGGDGHKWKDEQFAIGVYMDRYCNLWISSWNGLLHKYNTGNGKKEVFDVFNDGGSIAQSDRCTPICFTEDRRQRLWMGCLNGGLYVYDPTTNSFTSIPSNNNLSTALHRHFFVYPLYTDKEGNIWAGTDGDINVFNPTTQPFHTVDENDDAAFSPSNLTSIYQTRRGNILLATWGKGWAVYDSAFRLQKRFYDSVRHPPAHEQWSNYVWSFAEALDGKVWVGYQHGLIGIYDPANGQIRYQDVPEFDKKSVMAISADERSNIWFGLYSGNLGKWDSARQKFFIFSHPPQTLPNLHPVSDLVPDGKENLWVASDGNGVYRFNTKTEKITGQYINTEANAPYDQFVHTLTWLNDSVLGIGNAYKGFSLLNTKQKTVRLVTQQNGKPLMDVYGIAPDRQQNLWLATHEGLLRWNAKNKKMISFDEHDGLTIKRFHGKIVTLKDGRMVVPAETGFAYFLPDEINDLPAPPDVIVTSCSIFDKPVPLDSVWQQSEILQLKHFQNFITISFASISFANRNTTLYHYRMKGVNNEWTNTLSELSVTYSGLRPGTYRFQVWCENRDGRSSEHMTTFSVRILPPWWATWWAFTAYAILTAAVVYAVHRNRILRLRKKAAAQLSLMIATQEEERRRISRDLHDDVGTKLSALKLYLSSLQQKAALNGNEEIERLAAGSEEFLSETIRDVRELLLNLSPSVLEAFGYTTAVEGLVHKINETRQIRFNLVLFGMRQRLPKEYELALYRITQELINNVLKHAEASNATLQIGSRDGKVILMIEDDGKGFDVSAHKEGYGLHNLDARTRLLGGIMNIDSGRGRGTTVLIEVPQPLNS